MHAATGTEFHAGASAVPLMNIDRLALDKFDNNQREWLGKMLDPQKRYQIGMLISTMLGGDPKFMPDPLAGSYNLVHVMKFHSGQVAALRQVNLGTSMFPDEKTQNEVNVTRLVAERTAIPVACVHYAKLTEDPNETGTKDLDTDDLRPYILMQYLEHNNDMGNALNTPGLNNEDPLVLNQELDPMKLQRLYRLAANVLLDLSRLDFDAIGSPQQIDDDSWRITGRPLTRRMNELVATGGCRRADLPQSVFTSTPEYFVALAQLHITHLASQQHGAYSDELDCTQKYVARLLFRKLMAGRVPSRDKFKLWCDDFRPTNILLRGEDIAGVIDWEFAYAAPAEFSCAPPWWLLLQRPENWEAGWSDWKDKYENALVTFLKAMTEAEDAAIASERLTEEQRLSQKMRESWDNGDFWVMYCLQTDYAFDLIFWHGIFPCHYESCKDFKAAWEIAWSSLDDKEKDEARRFASDQARKKSERKASYSIVTAA